ncbi:MAG: hypothetical protein R2874_17540 [Desulfobacterales bacterium]
MTPTVILPLSRKIQPGGRAIRKKIRYPADTSAGRGGLFSLLFWQAHAFSSLLFEISRLLLQDPKNALVYRQCDIGVSGMGLADDIWRLGYAAKFFDTNYCRNYCLYGAAFVLDRSGCLVSRCLIWDLWSLPLTVAWVVLVINAINLIDGLDGLAAGVGFLVSLILCVLCLIGRNFVPAVILAHAIVFIAWFSNV